MAAQQLCRVEDLPPGSQRIFPGGPFGIGLFNRDGTVYALNNYCPHVGAPVCKGVVTGTTSSTGNYQASWEREGEILRCPWHGWEFDLKTGRSVAEPVKRVKTYPVQIIDGWITVDF